MKQVRSALMLAVTTALSSTASIAATPLELKSDVFVERQVVRSDGSNAVVLEKPNMVTPGDNLVFVVRYKNIGGSTANNFVVTNPLPPAVAFNGTSDDSEVVSIDGMGTHPIVSDGFMTRCMDLSKGPHRRAIRAYLPSPDHRGATPPMIAEVVIDMEYVGEETITVAAGTFDCRHFRYIDASEHGMGGVTHPTYEMWVTADADSIFVQGGVGGYMQTWYELVELDR